MIYRFNAVSTKIRRIFFTNRKKEILKFQTQTQQKRIQKEKDIHSSMFTYASTSCQDHTGSKRESPISNSMERKHQHAGCSEVFILLQTPKMDQSLKYNT